MMLNAHTNLYTQFQKTTVDNKKRKCILEHYLKTERQVLCRVDVQ